MSLIRLRTIQKPDSRQIVHNSCIFSNINSWHRAYTIASKTDTCFGKKRDFLQGSCYVTTLKGAHQYAYFLKLYTILYVRASFQLFSNILTSFTRGDFITIRKRTTEILTQIRQRFWKRRSKSFVEKLSDFTFVVDFGHEKTVYLWLFFFPVRKVSFTKRRPSTKQRPKKL